MAQDNALVGARVPMRTKKAVRQLAQEQGITESGWVRIHLEEAIASERRAKPGPGRKMAGKDAQIARLQSELRRLTGTVDALRGAPEEGTERVAPRRKAKNGRRKGARARGRRSDA